MKKVLVMSVRNATVPAMSDTPRTDKFYWFETGAASKARSWLEFADFARQLERELNHLKEMREGDNKLVMALAEALGISITCQPHMLGLVWEQFHDGVLGLAEKLAAAEALALALGNDGIEANNDLAAMARENALKAYAQLKRKP